MKISRPDKRFLVTLAGIMAAGLAIRLGFVLGRQSSVVLNGGDAFWYHFQAKLVAQGKGFLHPFDYFKDAIVAPGADHPPGFVLVLAFLDLFGIGTPQGQRIVMCFFGTASIGVVAFLGRRLASARVGLMAAAFAAVYPNFWINDGMLMVETLFILASAVALLATYRYLERQTLADALIIAGAITVAAMTRPEAAALFVILAAPLVAFRRRMSWTTKTLHLAVMALVPIVAFAPWVIYNLGRFETPVYISTGAGQTLAVGNCDLTYSGDFVGFYDTNCLLPPQIEPPSTRERSLADIEYRRIALDYMGSHKKQLPAVMAARVGRQWHLFRPGQSIGLDGYVEGRSGGPPGTEFGPVREALWSYYILLPASIIGLVILRRRAVAIWPLLTQPLLVTLVAASTFGITRYRAGAEVTIVVAAAVMLDLVARKLFPEMGSGAPGVGECTQERAAPSETAQNETALTGHGPDMIDSEAAGQGAPDPKRSTEHDPAKDTQEMSR